MAPNPHDALVRAIFSRPENAAGEIATLLPAAVAARLDLTTLELQSGSFVDPDLAQRHSDLLFSVALRGGRPAFVYVLIEHQSSDDPWMVLRLLGYQL